MSPKQAFRLAYGFVRADGRHGDLWRSEMAPFKDAAIQALSDRTWLDPKRLCDNARTRRTYAVIDKQIDRELNG